MNLPLRVFVCLLLLCISFCVPFPYFDPADSHKQQNPQQQQNEQKQQKSEGPKSAVIKGKYEGDSESERQLHIRQKSEETETRFDHSVEDVTDLRFPLESVITRIEEDSNDFHDRMELHQQGEAETGKDTESLEQTKLTFHHPPTSNAASSNNDMMRPSNSKNVLNIEMNSIEKTTDGQSDANGQLMEKSGPNLDQMETEKEEKNNETKKKSEKLEEKAEKTNGSNEKVEEPIAKTTGQKEELQKDQTKGLPMATVLNVGGGTVARNLPPAVIDVADIAAEGANGGAEGPEKETAAAPEEKGDTDADTEAEPTWWDKIVLGLRCARHDCRETLIMGEEQFPRVINGWKITRRARATAVAERKENLEIQTENYCKCEFKNL